MHDFISELVWFMLVSHLLHLNLQLYFLQNLLIGLEV